jgi:hypothetical protein
MSWLRRAGSDCRCAHEMGFSAARNDVTQCLFMAVRPEGANHQWRKNPTPYILRVKSEVSHGIRNFISHGIPPRWMDPEGMVAFRRLLSRNQNGIGRTDIDFDVGPNTHDVVSIDREKAEAGIRAIAALNIMDLADDLKFP